ncbi:MAG: reverse transcriptase family protein [Pirellulales bacterium]
MHERLLIAQLLATTLVNSPWHAAALVERALEVLGKPCHWIEPLVDRLLVVYPGPVRPRFAVVAEFIQGDAGFCRARLRRDCRFGFVTVSPEMQPGLWIAVQVPALCTAGDLAHWLGISLGELQWFANLQGFARRRPQRKLGHYHYRVLSKHGGAVRLIESPKLRLKTLQQRVLREILEAVPTHDAAHGFVRARSITTFAAPHVGRAVAARMDLQDFFPRIRRPRIAAIFRLIGYPEHVASLLAGLCTTTTPPWVWELPDLPPIYRLREARWLYAEPHLPQGAPTSPAIANLCAYRLDCRLQGLARAADARYTRYADDLAFSGDHQFARRAKRFLIHAAATAAEEGFVVHHRKTRIMRRSMRQHLAGVVVNERLNVRRSDYDRLKAILINCRRHGPGTQNRENHPDFRAHLTGRIAFVAQINPARGERLRELFEGIDGW